jgi:tetratricopeptide (TPR) repeat protein
MWLWAVWMPQANNRFAAASLQELESVVDVAHIDASFENTGGDAIFQLVQRYRLLELNERALVVLRRASPLDPDDEKMWLTWAAVAESVNTRSEALAVLRTYLRRHEQSTDARLALGRLYRRARLYKQASAEAKIVLRLDPDHIDAWRLLGTTAVDALDRATAESAFRKVVELAPKDWTAHVDLGNVLYDLQRPKEALPFFYEAVRLAPDAAETHFKLGQSLLRVAVTPADVQKAQHHLHQSLQLNPDVPRTRLLLGQSYMRQERWEEALREFRLVNESPLADVNARSTCAYNSAVVLNRQGKRADAAREQARHLNISAYLAKKRSLYDSILEKPTNLNLRLQLARLCATYREFDYSIGAYQRLLTYAPQALAEKQVGVREKVQIASRELAQVQARDAQVRSLLQTSNFKNKTSGRDRTSHGADSSGLQDAPLPIKEVLRDADYLFAQKRWDEARRAYLTAAQTDEKSGRAFQGAGLAMLQGEDKAQGINFLRHALSIEPNLSRANFVIGSLCLEAEIREAAIHYLEMATRAAPDNAAYWHQLSMAYAAEDAQLKEAESAARRAVELDTRN